MRFDEGEERAACAPAAAARPPPRLVPWLITHYIEPERQLIGSAITHYSLFLSLGKTGPALPRF
jgi:hypothetical protein